MTGDEAELAHRRRNTPSLTIEVGTHFQFRNTGDEPLCIVITTMPPWPGEHEAAPVAGRW